MIEGTIKTIKNIKTKNPVHVLGKEQKKVGVKTEKKIKKVLKIKMINKNIEIIIYK